MIDNKTIGLKIKSLRKIYKLSQQELADKLHVSFQAVSNWERGITQIDINNILALAKIFNVSCDYILSQKENSETLYLGIDGGGTKTEFVLFAADGKIIERFVLGSSNPNEISIDKTVALISSGINKVIQKFPNLKYVFGGIAGMLTGDNLSILKNEIKKIFPYLETDFDGDIENLFWCDNRANAALIVGTGSVLFVKSQNKRIRYGGYGFLIDNYGSGFDIGREAIRTYLFDLEHNENSSIAKLMLKDNVKKDELLALTYKNGKSYVASFAHYVFEAYKCNDQKAIKIINDQVEYLSDLIRSASKNRTNNLTLITAGGIIENYKSILVPLIKKKVNVEIIFSPLPQIFGSCRKCLDMDNKLTKEFDSKFIENYKGLFYECN